jgi:histone-lysine N-methyltransferase SETMAR
MPAYIKTLTELGKHLRQVWPHKNPTEILLQHDNARPHTSLKTWEAITKFGWTVLHHPPYSPNLAPSDFHIFGALKDAIHGMKFESDDNVSTWLCGQDKAWY